METNPPRSLVHVMSPQESIRHRTEFPPSLLESGVKLYPAQESRIEVGDRTFAFETALAFRATHGTDPKHCSDVGLLNRTPALGVFDGMGKPVMIKDGQEISASREAARIACFQTGVLTEQVYQEGRPLPQSEEAEIMLTEHFLHLHDLVREGTNNQGKTTGLITLPCTHRAPASPPMMVS